MWDIESKTAFNYLVLEQLKLLSVTWGPSTCFNLVIFCRKQLQVDQFSCDCFCEIASKRPLWYSIAKLLHLLELSN